MKGLIFLLLGIIAVLAVSGCISFIGPRDTGSCVPEFECSANWSDCVKPGVRLKVCIDTECGAASYTETESCEYKGTADQGSQSEPQDLLHGQQVAKETDWEFNDKFTRCTNWGVVNDTTYYRILVYVTNNGYEDIQWDEWVVHRIDGVEQDVWHQTIKNVTSNVVTVVGGIKYTQFYNYGIVMWPYREHYTAGSHFIEVGTSPDEIKTFSVFCGEE